MQKQRQHTSFFSVQIKEKARKSGSIGTCYPLLWVYPGREIIRAAAFRWKWTELESDCDKIVFGWYINASLTSKNKVLVVHYGSSLSLNCFSTIDCFSQTSFHSMKQLQCCFSAAAWAIDTNKKGKTSCNLRNKKICYYALSITLQIYWS